MWTTRMPRRARGSAVRALEALTPTALRGRHTPAGVGVVCAPYPVRPDLSYSEYALCHERALRVALRRRPLAADLVHAHTGIFGGWAALHNVRPGTRVFVTEHATFIDKIVREPRARAMYDTVLSRAAGVFAVGEGLRTTIAEAFPHHAHRLGILPNAVRFDLPRDLPVSDLRRWLYVGSIIPRKNIFALIEAFARCRERDSALTLTLVGSGALYGRTWRLAKRLGVGDAVTFRGAVGPEAALALLREHDLLVHPSQMETFGMTLIEAVAAGMPVLATRCGGPEETLAGVEHMVGELVEVQAGPDALVDGYWRLRDRFPHGLDLARAATDLAARYGYAAVAEAHLATWSGTGGLDVAPMAEQAVR
ncbi:glycosyltransferase family 4 protein [Luedemannella flava]